MFTFGALLVNYRLHVDKISSNVIYYNTLKGVFLNNEYFCFWYVKYILLITLLT